MSGSANGIRYLIRVWGFTIQEILDLLRIASGANGCSSDGLLTLPFISPNFIGPNVKATGGVYRFTL
ncbi:hypothetical protein AFLA_008809 [Aspergillus flavus NRRL3357]|nr:hypothetical protein AFLA_008809 [Aspergillus flavus NRRL3357]